MKYNVKNLEKFYKFKENFKDFELKLTPEQLQKMEELEEDLIKNEVLPALRDDIAPRLEPIKRDLVLVVEYHPNEPISVALSRKVRISEITGAKTLIPHSSIPVKSDEKTEKITSRPMKHIENHTKGLKVSFPDGTVIWHRYAIQTFIDTLRKIGLNRIPPLGIKFGGGYNLVGKEKRPPASGCIWQHECDGYYIYSNMTNKDKVKTLKYISKYYRLRLKIEEKKPK